MSTQVKFTKKQMYDIMGAVRGPDNEGVEGMGFLKEMVTGRVRSILFKKEDDCGGAVYTTYPLTKLELKKIEGIVYENDMKEINYHFFWHLNAAVIASRRHRIWGGVKRAEALETILDPDVMEG